MAATPQQLLRPAKTANQPTPSVNFRAGNGPQISGQFLNTIEAKQQAEAKRRAKAEKDRLDFAAITVKNKLATARVQSEVDLTKNKGVNALQNVGSIKTQFVNQQTAILSGLSDADKGSYAVRKEVMKASGEYDRFAIGYASSEGQKVVESSYTENVANEMNSMVNGSADINFLRSRGAGDLEESIRKRAERIYGDDPNKVLESGITAGEMTEKEITAGVSEGVRRSIQQQLMVGNFALAEETLRSFQDEIVPDDKLKIQKMIASETKKSEDLRGVLLGEAAFRDASGDMVMATKIAMSRAGGDIAMFKLAQTQIKTKFDMKTRQDAKNEKDLYNSVYEAAANNGGTLPPAAKRMKSEDFNKLVNQLNANGGGRAKVTNYEVKDKAMALMQRLPDAEVIKINVRKEYGMDLNEKSIVQLERVQNMAKKSIKTGERAGAEFDSRIPNDIAKGMYQKVGLKPDGKKAQVFRENITDRYLQYMEANPSANKTETVRAIRKEILDAVPVQDISGFFSSEKLGREYDGEAFVREEDAAKARELRLVRSKANLPPISPARMAEMLKDPIIRKYMGLR